MLSISRRDSRRTHSAVATIREVLRRRPDVLGNERLERTPGVNSGSLQVVGDAQYFVCGLYPLRGA